MIVDLNRPRTVPRPDFITKLPRHARRPFAADWRPGPDLERETREALSVAGADAVFERQADIDSYRREAAAIVSFWVRNQHLDAVGT